MPTELEIEPKRIEPRFTGAYDVTLDSQGRVIVPSPCLSQGLVDSIHIVPRRFDRYKYLGLFPSEGFTKYFQDYADREGLTEEEFVELSVFLFNDVARQKLNASKPRITLTEPLIQHLFNGEADQGEVLTLVGAGILFVLWRKTEYEDWQENRKQKIEERFLQQKVGNTSQ